MRRFQYQKQPNHPPRFLLSVCVFLIITLLFLQGISSLLTSTVTRQKESLENAIMHSVTYCYTVEGSYPGDLAYLKEYYGLTYDEELFFVDYHSSGANIFPDITIVERKKDH